MERALAIMAILSTLAISLMITAFVVPPQAAAEDDVSFPTWSAVVADIEQQLAQGEETYQSGNTAGANAEFTAAYSSTYVASNLAAVISSTIGSDVQARQQQLFMDIAQLSYMSGNETPINEKIVALSGDLDEAAATLDADPNLAAPDVYADNLSKQIAEDRKKLDAAKKTKSERGERSWSDVANEMNGILDEAYQAYEQGDGAKGAELVNEAYYQYYEKLGFEKNVMNAISGNRVSQVEYQFKETRQAMNNGESKETTQQYVDGLKVMLQEDATTLDGGAAGQVNPFVEFATSSFGQAFIILLREGLEAILVVVAIIAYLIKSGNRHLVKYIYWGAVAGLIGSGLLALLFALLFQGSGPQQEIVEGVVALFAMVMLLYTSNWMLSRSSSRVWNAYITNKTVAAVSKGSLVSLALLSFLAVFREGAETVMFYQAIFSMTSGSTSGIWGGFAAAAMVLAVIFVLIRFTSVKIPIKPFFLITSALMAVLVVIFAGGGVHALIEGDAINGTYLPTVPTNDWLGLYPYVETIVAQILAGVAVVVLGVIALLRARTRPPLVDDTVADDAVADDTVDDNPAADHTLTDDAVADNPAAGHTLADSTAHARPKPASSAI